MVLQSVTSKNHPILHQHDKKLENDRKKGTELVSPYKTLIGYLATYFYAALSYNKLMIILLLLWLAALTISTIIAAAITAVAGQDNRINNWTFIIDLLYKAGYEPQTISKILDYYTI